MLRDLTLGLAQLVDAGVPLRQGLQTLIDTAPPSATPGLRAALARVDAGDSLAEALSGARGLLSPEDVQRVRAAERIGTTAQALKEIADGYRRRVEVRRTIWRGAAYPLAVVGAWAVLSPLPEALVGAGGGYLVAVVTNLTAVALIVVGVLVGLPWLATGSALAPQLRRLAWRAPWPAALVVTASRARFARMLARNLEAGLGLREALETAAAVTGDVEVVARMPAALARIEAGEPLAPALVDGGLVAPADRVVLTTGEAAGALVSSLDALAARYEEELERGSATFLRLVGLTLTALALAHVAWQVYQGFTRTLGGGGELQDALDQLDKELPKDLRGYPFR